MHSIISFLSRYFLWSTTILTALVLMPFTGNVHLFDWDEINFAECAREMLVTNSYHTVLLNYQPFWEKPPLYIWLQVISMKIFGVNEWAARFPNVLNGFLTLYWLFYIGKRWYSKDFGQIWSWMHLSCILPHLYFRSGIIDPWYNLFGLIAVISAIEIFRNGRWKWALTGGITLGLSVLTKGPVMVLITFLTFLIVLVFFVKKISKQQILMFALYIIAFLISGSMWFFHEFLTGHKEIILAFIDYQIRLFKTEDSGHGGFFLYHFVVVLLGCFPASVWLLRYFSKQTEKDLVSNSMAVLLIVVLVLFSIVKTKIVHYSSISYYAVSFLATFVIHKNYAVQKWQKLLLLSIASIMGIILAVAGTVEYWKHWLIPYLTTSDLFAAENLKNNVEWYGYEFLSGIILIVLLMWFVKRTNYSLQTYFKLLIWQILWLSFSINSFVGKIEQYTQSSAIHFFQYCADKGITVDTYGYKSYAALFYGQRKPLSKKEQRSVNHYWKDLENAGYEKLSSYNLAYLNYLIYDSEKYPVGLVCKIQDEENVLKTGKFRKLYSKGGYVFFMKVPSSP